MTITQALATHTAEAPRTWPAPVQQAARRAVIDTCACMVAGRGDPAALAISSTLSRWQSGGALDLVSAKHTAAPWAAMVNATAAHALDYDDVLETAAAHASAVFVPALLALAQERKASGAQVLDALAISFDVMNALAAAVNYPHYARGWHTTLTLGAPSAAAGCARLLGLDTGARGASDQHRHQLFQRQQAAVRHADEARACGDGCPGRHSGGVSGRAGFDRGTGDFRRRLVVRNPVRGRRHAGVQGGGGTVERAARAGRARRVDQGLSVLRQCASAHRCDAAPAADCGVCGR